MTGLAVLLALGLALIWLIAVFATAWRLTHPVRRTYASMVRRNLPGDPSELPGAGRAFTQWPLASRGRELPVWDIPGDDPAGPVAILTHGWGNSRYDALTRLSAFLPRCSRVIAWDQPGHGDAPGTCDLGVGEAQDLTELLNHIDAPRLVLFGWSMGAGVSIACAAANPERIVGVIAQAPYRLAYTPARGVLRESALPWRATLWPAMWAIGVLRGRSPGWAGKWPAFDRAQHASKLRCPLLVLHGENDRVCPPEDGHQIAEAAAHGRFISIPNAGHNGLWANPDTTTVLVRHIGDMLKDLSTPHAAIVQ